MQLKNILNISENVNKIYQNVCDDAKTVVTGTVIVLRWLMRNVKSLKPIVYLKKLEKEEHIETQRKRRT